MAHTDSTSDQPYAGVSYSQATGWVAWVLLGGIVLVLLGTVHVCMGLLALISPSLLAGSRSDLLLPFSLTAIAWIHLLVGIVGVVVGVVLIRGLVWARAMAIALGCLAVLVNFLLVQVHPVWSVTAIVLAVVVIYAVSAHGQELADAYADS